MTVVKEKKTLTCSNCLYSLEISLDYVAYSSIPFQLRLKTWQTSFNKQGINWKSIYNRQIKKVYPANDIDNTYKQLL